MERAQLVCRRSAELAAGAEPRDVGGAALILSRVAHHDRATLEHALAIGRGRARDDPADEASKRGARLLERVVALLGAGARAAAAAPGPAR